MGRAVGLSVGQRKFLPRPGSAPGHNPVATKLATPRGGSRPERLLFPNGSGGIIRRSNFQQIWIPAADAAGWPMTTPLQRTRGYGTRNKKALNSPSLTTRHAFRIAFAT